MLKGVIFDVGGTICYFYPNQTWRQTLNKLNRILSVKPKNNDVIRWVRYGLNKNGQTPEQFIANYARVQGVKITRKKAAQIFKKIGWTKKIIVYSDVRKTLDLLEKNGLKIGFASNMDAHSAKKIKKKKLFQRFSTGVFSCFEKCVKPEKRFYQTIIKRMKLLPSQMAWVGDDKLVDYTVPKRLGFTCFTVDRRKKHDGKIKTFTNLYSIAKQIVKSSKCTSN